MSKIKLTLLIAAILTAGVSTARAQSFSDIFNILNGTFQTNDSTYSKTGQKSADKTNSTAGTDTVTKNSGTKSGTGLGDILGNIFGNNAGTSGQSSQSKPSAPQTGDSSNSSSGLGGILGNLLEGVFSSSNLTLADLQGDWLSSGPAVCFQSDNFLKNAGGLAAAAAVETKLQPYYKQYGLTGATLTIDQNANFVLRVKGIPLRGVITATNEKGVFEFNFMAFGSIRLGTMKTYVQKTSRSMDVMFDSTKMIDLFSKISKFTGSKSLQTISSLLSSYDGLCVGFKLSAR